MSPTTAAAPVRDLSTDALARRYRADPALTVAALAREVGLSRATVSGRFHAAGIEVRQRARRPPSTEPMSSYTLKFTAELYAAMRRQAEATDSTMRDYVRQALRREVEAAWSRGEVAGPLYAGAIGQAPEDCSVGPTTGPASGRRRRLVKHTFKFTTRFWRQVKGLGVARGIDLRALAVNVLTRAVREGTTNGRRPRAAAG